jgi:hypothetical protein
MITENSTGYKSFTATAVAIAAHVRVVLGSAGTISVAGASDIGIGVTLTAIPASETGTVKLWGATGTFMMTADNAITIGATLYATHEGKVDDTGTYKINMISLATATADDDVIECAKVDGGTVATAPYVSTDVADLTAAGTLQTDAAPIVSSVVNATGASQAGLLLPTSAAGLHILIYNASANTLKIWPASGAQINAVGADTADTIATHTTVELVGVSTTLWSGRGLS